MLIFLLFPVVGFVPLKTQEHLVGLFIVGRWPFLTPYTQGNINLLLAVADQAVLAIENVRLYTLELEQVASLHSLERMKSVFLLTVPHQPKTHLSAPKGFHRDAGGGEREERLIRPEKTAG